MQEQGLVISLILLCFSRRFSNSHYDPLIMVRQSNNLKQWVKCTPRHIIDFIVAAVDPKKDETICDPTCGTAGFLISAYKHILKQHGIPLNPPLIKGD
ncbi:N-6 DNA methylase [bacterium]|nr:N-6 DNA methylase [bacterium]